MFNILRYFIILFVSILQSTNVSNFLFDPVDSAINTIPGENNNENDSGLDSVIDTIIGENDNDSIVDSVLDNIPEEIGKVPRNNDEIIRNLSKFILTPLKHINTDIIPTLNISSRFPITMSFALLAVTNFDEISGIFNIVAFLELFWIGENLPTWNASLVGGKNSLPVRTAAVWVPQVFVLNPAQEMKDLTSMSRYLRLQSNGSVKWEIITGIEAACSVDVRNFPIDTQTCFIKIAPWGYSSSELMFHGHLDTTKEALQIENSAWAIQSIVVDSINSKTTPYIEVTITIRRLYEYFLMNVLIPPILLSVLSPFVFILPASSGERISFSVTCFLAFSVYVSMLSDNMPKSSSPIAHLSYFMMYMLINSCCVVVSTIISLRIYNKETSDQKVSRSIRIAVNIARLKFCLVKNPRSNKNNDNNMKMNAPSIDSEHFETPVETICTDIERRRLSIIQEHFEPHIKSIHTDFEGRCVSYIPEDFVQQNYKAAEPSAWKDCEVTWEMVGSTLDWFFFFVYLSWMLFTVFSYLLSIGFI